MARGQNEGCTLARLRWRRVLDPHQGLQPRGERGARRRTAAEARVHDRDRLRLRTARGRSEQLPLRHTAGIETAGGLLCVDADQNPIRPIGGRCAMTHEHDPQLPARLDLACGALRRRKDLLARGVPVSQQVSSRDRHLLALHEKREPVPRVRARTLDLRYERIVLDPDDEGRVLRSVRPDRGRRLHRRPSRGLGVNDRGRQQQGARGREH
jgi:hypothetical protein